MNLSIKERLIVFSIGLTLLTSGSWFLLVPSKQEKTMELPYWGRIGTNPALIDRWQERSLRKDFTPVVIQSPKLMAQFIKDYPSGYFPTTIPTNKLGTGEQAAIKWIALVNNEFLVYTMVADYFEPTEHPIRLHVKNNILYFDTEYDPIGLTIGIFIVFVITLMPTVTIAAYLTKNHAITVENTVSRNIE
jgi:hypothetical protein